MEVTLNEEVRPIGNDDLIYTITAIDTTKPLIFGDIIRLTWENHTTNNSETISCLITKDDAIDESPFLVIKLLFQSVANISTVTVKAKSRFVLDRNTDEDLKDDPTIHNLTINFEEIILSKDCKNNEIYNEAIETRRLKGNSLYGHSKYSQAVKLYNTAIAICDYRTDYEVDKTDILVKCQNNLAACYMQLEQYEKARDTLRKVEQVDPTNTKMMWRTGRCLMKLSKNEEAEKYLANAKQNDNESKIILKDLNEVRKKLIEEKKASKALAEKMIQGLQRKNSEENNLPKKPIIERHTTVEKDNQPTETIDLSRNTLQKPTSSVEDKSQVLESSNDSNQVKKNADSSTDKLVDNTSSNKRSNIPFIATCGAIVIGLAAIFLSKII